MQTELPLFVHEWAQTTRARNDALYEQQLRDGRTTFVTPSITSRAGKRRSARSAQSEMTLYEKVQLGRSALNDRD